MKLGSGREGSRVSGSQVGGQAARWSSTTEGGILPD